MIVVDGTGMLKTVTPMSPDFSAWQNGIGAMGVVLQVTFKLLPAYNIESKNVLHHSIWDSVGNFTTNVYSGKPFSWTNCFNISVASQTCVDVERGFTLKSLTPPYDKNDGTGCCAEWLTPGGSAVISSVDGDMYSGANLKPKMQHRLIVNLV
jgi:hypothetical protein